MNLANLRCRKSLFCIIVASLLLSACKGGDDNSSNSSDSGNSGNGQIPIPIPPPPPQAPPSAQNVSQSVILSDKPHQISLASSVQDPSNLPLSLSYMRSLSSDCAEAIITPSSLTFSVNQKTANVCFYRYTVSNLAQGMVENDATADVYVRFSSSNDRIEPLSLPHFNTETPENLPITINLKTQLNPLNINLDDYVLVDDIVVLNGGTVTADIAKMSIEFTPDYTSSITRLLYKLQSLDGANVIAGSIDISSTRDGIALPTTSNFIYSETRAIMGESISNIDIKTHIPNFDTKQLQLMSVSAFNSSATLNKDVCPSCFNFKANQQGTYNVDYVIKDAHNGWASGIASITVGKPWVNIFGENTEAGVPRLFTATPETIEAKKHGIVFDPTDVDNYPQSNARIQIQVPRLTHAIASEYCAAFPGLRLPSSQELRALFNQHAQSFYLSDQWPVSSRYWTTTEGTAISLADGSLLNTTKQGYVSCTDAEIIDLTITPAKIILWKNDKAPKLAAKAIYKTAKSKEITDEVSWRSDKPSIVSIDKNGELTAISKGRAFIYAEFGNKTSISPADVNVFEIIDVAISPQTATLTVTNTVQLNTSVTILPSGSPAYSDPTLWKSDNNNVASVDSNGIVTAHSIGKATISATIKGVTSLQTSEITVNQTSTHE